MKFAELALDQTATETVHVTAEMIALFAEVTGDRNPVHTDAAYAVPRFGSVIAHGMLLVGFFSALMAHKLPGPGCVARDVKVRFKAPVRPGDDVVIVARVIELVPRIRKVVLEGRAMVGDTVILQITAEALLEA